MGLCVYVCEAIFLSADNVRPAFAFLHESKGWRNEMLAAKEGLIWFPYKTDFLMLIFFFIWLSKNPR